jgi:hypothetical protein
MATVTSIISRPPVRPQSDAIKDCLTLVRTLHGERRTVEEIRLARGQANAAVSRLLEAIEADDAKELEVLHRRAS